MFPNVSFGRVSGIGVAMPVRLTEAMIPMPKLPPGPPLLCWTTCVPFVTRHTAKTGALPKALGLPALLNPAKIIEFFAPDIVPWIALPGRVATQPLWVPGGELVLGNR